MQVRALLRTLILLVSALASAVQADGRSYRVPVVFHVARLEGQPVADATFLATQLERANAIFRPLGIELIARASRPLPAGHARLHVREDRDALAAHLEPGVLNCFIVATLMDVDEPGRERRGVHWRQRRDPRNHFVVVSAISGPNVLAHELGHFFGNPQHSAVVGNLMSYRHGEQLPVLDAAQQARVRRTVAEMVRLGELTAR
jgi:hypothetical protein